jgi:uncharacterized protein
MQMLDGRLVHSASDLNAFTECLHLAARQRAVAEGRAQRPERDDPTAALLARKGDEHEARHLERLRSMYATRLVAFEQRPAATRAAYEAAERESVAAMARGADIIYQATFFDGSFLGRVDFLRRVETPSARWPWSYEVIDTKLALSAKPYFLIQLCNYSEHVARVQGNAPKEAAIVLGSGSERRFAVDEFAAYYRRLKAEYLAAIEQGADAYPVECAHCDLCAWRDVCARRRDADDHLSLVAGIRRDQIRKLEDAGVGTLAALAGAGDERRPKRLRHDTYANLRAQAAEQHRYRRARATGSARHSYRFRETPDPKSGFARLPRPSAGDIFFDIEGDPMYRPDRSLEYLFGVYLPEEERYRAFWGTDPVQERLAFESFVDFVVARRQRFPDLHVYHYAAYETTALKRLMGRFASRENEIDGFLVAGTFVDLFPVVKQSLYISQPSYSIKKVEALYGYERATLTRGGDDSIVMFESWLESRDPATLEDIRAYNEDDCRSTFALRDWLVRLRGERNTQLAAPIEWREPPPDRPAPENAERSTLEAQLLQDVPAPDSLADLRAYSDRVRARWLLGNLLAYHRREQKPEWWEFFHRIDHPAELVDDDNKALGGLRYCADEKPFQIGGRGNWVHTFSFPEQEHGFESGQKAVDAATGKSAGTIIAIDDVVHRLQIRLAKAIDPPSRLTAIIPDKPINDRKKREAVERIARAYAAGTLDGDHPATVALLEGRRPRLAGRPPGAVVQPAHVTKEAVSAVVQALRDSYLVVQGPPGTGKSTIGAHTIVDLLAAGKRVALAANGHKALHNLLDKVERTAVARGVTFRGCHKSSDQNAGSVYCPAVDRAQVADAPSIDGFAGCALVSGTTYAWAEPSQAGAYDVVVIDEAGQVSLADALLTSLVARSVVLLGDPQQLPQVAKGSHPLGTDSSILQHLLGEAATIADDRGIFLDRSYRMQPAIDAFVSRAFYDGRLEADELNAANCIASGGVIARGLHFTSIDHDGNARRSHQEAARIADDVAALLAAGTVTIRDCPNRALTPADILVVTPYNMQRAAITDRLRHRGLAEVRVGTVDKFQGQEAPVVFYSMTTSSAELAPRGLDFLLNPNRLNVAISRAQAYSVLVCSPHLLASRATTIEQMQLLNLLCAYVEAATSPAPVTPRAAMFGQLELLLPLG